MEPEAVRAHICVFAVTFLSWVPLASTGGHVEALHPAEGGGTARSADDFDGIKATGMVLQMVLREPVCGGLAEVGAFVGVDGVNRASVGLVLAGFDLDDEDGAAAAGDDVNLVTPGGTDVAGEDFASAGLQETGGPAFAPSSAVWVVGTEAFEEAPDGQAGAGQEARADCGDWRTWSLSAWLASRGGA